VTFFPVAAWNHAPLFLPNRPSVVEYPARLPAIVAPP
jgi:hypothetical protein